MAKRKSAPVYSVHPGIQMVQDWISTLKTKTGRSLDEWLAHIRKSGPKDEVAARDWIKKEHGMGTNTAWWLAERVFRPEAAETDSPKGYLKAAYEYVETQYAGKKAALRPIYDKLLELGLAIGKDAKACPCKTMVPLYREHVFVEIKPTTNSRIDLGFALAKLPDSKLGKRLIDTGGKAEKDRITHRIPISNAAEVDSDVKKWLKIAYDLDAAE